MSFCSTNWPLVAEAGAKHELLFNKPASGGRHWQLILPNI